MIQIMLISLQRLGNDRLIELFVKEHLPHLEKYPWEAALVKLTLGLVSPARIAPLARTDDQKAEFYCFSGSRSLTVGDVDGARAEFDRCLRVSGQHIEQRLALVQQSWPSQRAADPNVVASVGSLVERWKALRAAGRFGEALEVAKTADSLGEIHLANTRPEQRLALLNNLAIAYLETNVLGLAEVACRRALQIREDERLALTVNAAITRNVLGQVQRKLGDLAPAIESFKMAIEIRSTIGEQATPEIANVLGFLGDTYRDTGAQEEAAHCYRTAAQILGSASGEYGELARTVQERLADHLVQYGPPDEAEDVCRRVAETVGRNYPNALDMAVRAQSRLSAVLESVGKSDEAQTIHAALSEALLHARGPEDLTYLDSLGAMARNLINQGKYSEAKVFTTELVDTILRIGASGRSATEAFWAHALASYHAGDFSTAVQFVRRVLQSEDLTRSRKADANRLAGNALHELFDFAGSLPYRRASVEDQSGLYGKWTPQYVLALYDLGQTLLNLDKLEEANTVLADALQHGKQVYGERADEVAQILNGLGVVAMGLRNTDAAERYLSDAVAMEEELLGPGAAFHMSQNLAAILAIRGRTDAARAQLEQSTKAIRSKLGESSSEYVNSLVALGEVHWKAGEYAQAEKMLLQALDHAKPVWGELNPLFVKLLEGLSAAQASLNKNGEAFETLLQAATLQSTRVVQTLATATEEERLKSLKRFHAVTQALLGLACTRLQNNPVVLCAAWNVWLQRKGLDLDVLAMQRAAAHRFDNPTVREIASEVADLRRQLAAIELVGPRVGDGGAVDYKPYDDSKSDLAARIGKLEEVLATAILSSKGLTSILSVSVEQVVKTIPASSVLIDFAAVRDFPLGGEGQSHDATGGGRYVAFVATSDSGQPQLVDFGSANPINDALRFFGATISGKPPEQDQTGEEADTAFVGTAAVSDPLGTIASLLIDPLLRAVPAHTRRLMLVPDGALSCVPFGALVNGSGVALLEMFDLCYLAACRDLLRSEDQIPEAGRAVIVACPDYELTRDVDSPNPGNQLEVGAKTGAAWRAISRQTSDLVRGDADFQPLPGTRTEGQIVADMFGVKAWTDSLAVKSRVLRVQSPLVLHIATHGFFLESRIAEMMEELGMHFTMAAEHTIGGRLSVRLENPLLRSGLALAGANTWIRYQMPPEEAGDGLLTAEDVAGMELGGTQLVYLSACDTALGDVRSGIGVMGLRRSFLAAGTRRLVMSMWKVPDVGTCLLVRRFYENLLHRSMACDASLRDAQLFLRDMTVADLRQTAESDTRISEIIREFLDGNRLIDLSVRPFLHERYWGGFISMGDYRALAGQRTVLDSA
jgi:CHAT domain-containing protein/tetratricopeptide (TPR) repeat protein